MSTAWIDGRGADADVDLAVQDHFELVDGRDVVRVGHGNDQDAVLGVLDRHELVPLHEVDGHGLEEFGVDAEIGEVEVAQVALLGQGLGQRLLGDQACVHQQFADALSPAVGLAPAPR